MIAAYRVPEDGPLGELNPQGIDQVKNQSYHGVVIRESKILSLSIN